MSTIHLGGRTGKALRPLRKAGFKIESLGSGHLRITAPDGSQAIQSSSAGNIGALEQWVKKVIARGSVATAKTGRGQCPSA